MGMDLSDDDGYGGFYDQRGMGSYEPGAPMPMASRAKAMMRATTMMGIGAYSYVPDLSPVGSGENYYPGDTYEDAKALAYLGYNFPNPNTDGPTGGEEFEGTGGDAATDMAQLNGAWSPKLQSALKRFEMDHGMNPDGWIGPETRAAIAAAIVAKDGGGMLPPVPRPDDLPHNGDMPIPPNRGGSITPVSTMPTNQKYLLIGGAGLGLLLVGWYLTK